PATFDLTLHFPLPPSLHPELVVSNLHAYEPLLQPNPYLQGYHRRPVDLDDLIADPFFTEHGTNIVSYEVHDRIPVVLGLTKDVRFPAIFQSFPAGVRVRADAAAGTRVRSIYEVCRGAGAGGVAGGGGAGSAWELVERSHVECSAVLKPFIMKSFEAAHRDLCQKVLDNIV
ncbi:hypothetical protein M406DRAFT_234181, partial [Cryphonectria parasitica EP155]